MAKVTTTLVTFKDDIDGADLGDDFETIRFTVDGRTYEFDTSPAHAAEFRGALAKYIEKARPVARAAGRRKGASNSNIPAIRAWAQSNGYSVSDRGRIPADVIAAYEAAN